MSEFLFFVPGKKAVQKEGLSTLGLDTIISSPKCREVTEGPCAKGSGCVFVEEGGSVKSPSYKKDKQTWIDCGDYCMGIFNDDPPTEESLSRKNKASGYWIEMADGCSWLVPMARSFSVGMPLPTRLVLGEDGKSWVSKPLERFAKFSSDAQVLADVFFDYNGTDPEGRQIPKGEEKKLTIDDYMQMIGTALNVNYRIDRNGLGLLGLVTFAEGGGEDSSGNIVECLKAIVDFPGFEQLVDEMEEEDVKKKNHEESDSSEGE